MLNISGETGNMSDVIKHLIKNWGGRGGDFTGTSIVIFQTIVPEVRLISVS